MAARVTTMRWGAVLAVVAAVAQVDAGSATRTSTGATPTLAVRAADTLPAGGVTVTQPAQTAGEAYYKIAQSESVTFGWSFTSLQTNPSRLYVMASCSQNGYVYPIAPSPTGVPGDATQVVWSPYQYSASAAANGQPALAAAEYRLLIFDDNGPSAAARGGQFAPNNAVQFAMYYPQLYTPLAGTWLALTRMELSFVQ